MGGTTYTITAFADNKLINDTSSYKAMTVNISTSDLPQIQSTSVTFSGSIPTSTGDSIRQKLAKNMGVNPLWLTGQSVTPSTRMLADGTGTTTTTTFAYNVIYDRSKPSYTPSGIIGNLDSATATSELTTLVGTAPTYGATNAVQTGTAPSLTSPSVTTKTDTSVTLSATSSQVGTIYAACSTSSGYTAYSWQVVDGLDGTSSAVPHGSATVATAATAVTLTVSNMSAGRSYSCYLTACNSYPLWSTCSDVTTSTTVTVTTSGSSSTDSSAVVMGTGVLAALFLIFN
ncbi:unnamed protein product [Blepharisma stoltei]|uniref:Ig-like domain-containing protein n=1 Tax=Blepharisma stoltei TaxID=1481888 RepID=A0AAU9K0Q1_9CILI|nr:unnamed protein product [Blepharisma stoltei]